MRASVRKVHQEAAAVTVLYGHRLHAQISRKQAVQRPLFGNNRVLCQSTIVRAVKVDSSSFFPLQKVPLISATPIISQESLNDHTRYNQVQ